MTAYSLLPSHLSRRLGLAPPHKVRRPNGATLQPTTVELGGSTRVADEPEDLKLGPILGPPARMTSAQ
jgi:hypothetical protein